MSLNTTEKRYFVTCVELCATCKGAGCPACDGQGRSPHDVPLSDALRDLDSAGENVADSSRRDRDAPKFWRPRWMFAIGIGSGIMAIIAKDVSSAVIAIGFMLYDVGSRIALAVEDDARKHF